MSPEEEIHRAVRAEQILGDDLFKEACQEIEQAILNGIQASPLKDVELREKLCQQYIILQTLIGRFRTHMETGKLAEATLRERAMLAAKKVVNW